MGKRIGALVLVGSEANPSVSLCGNLGDKGLNTLNGIVGYPNTKLSQDHRLSLLFSPLHIREPCRIQIGVRFLPPEKRRTHWEFIKVGFGPLHPYFENPTFFWGGPKWCFFLVPLLKPHKRVFPKNDTQNKRPKLDQGSVFSSKLFGRWQTDALPEAPKASESPGCCAGFAKSLTS